MEAIGDLRMPLVLLLFLSLGAGAADRPAPKEMLAFYYGWYGNPQISGKWFHWKDVDEAHRKIGESTHFPVLGAYDSHDPAVIARHVREARQAGITGFIMTWWGQRDFHDLGMGAMLTAAGQAGLKITAYYETCKPRGAPTVEGTVQDVLYLLEQYGGNAAWLKVKGKPVVFVYGRAIGELKLDSWRQVIGQVNQRYPGGAVFIGDQISAAAADIFDGIHTYNPTGRTAGKPVAEIRAWAKETYPQWVRTAGTKIACVTVIPGYDDTTLGRPAPRPTTDRHSGETYRALWEEAIAARPDWVLITSWNEWHEGSEIEPSVEIGPREANATGEFARRFLGR